MCRQRCHHSIVALCCAFVLANPSSWTAQAQDIIASAADDSRHYSRQALYEWSPDEDQLLDEIQFGCFQYFWTEIGRPACLVKDRTEAEICSVAAVGFQLSSLPIGVERGWITREEGAQRAKTVLASLLQHDDNKKFGIYLHFIDHNTGGLVPNAPQVQASTVDHALLAAGALPAATYFGGEVAELVDRLLQQANWRRYVIEKEKLISFGWRPEDPSHMDGPGQFRPWLWKWASAEEQLVYLLAVGSPEPDHRVDPAMYYRLDRRVMSHEQMPPFVASWNGALFTYFFAHCWIDFLRFGPDDPAKFGSTMPRVDWFENSRRAVLTHRRRCEEMATEYATLSSDRWGLSPCNGFRDDGSTTYYVPAVRPNIADEENWCGGTVATYAAGSAIMFTPRESIAALREFRNLRRDGKLLAWRDVKAGGHGLADSFNLDQGRASFDTLGIDAGPMLLAIENVRTGLIWRLFHEHEAARRAVRLLQWSKRSEHE